ncbi:chromosome partitioning protein ParA [Yersinia massiliensis]|jgi:secretion system chaperone SseA|uniref:Chromosome segregation ATPase n=2 Tax=Yersinia TaxID=629 RepID=A0AAI8ZQJ2_YERFR|nr:MULTISPECIES: chromosome partitioning protein ParA [Yersinia]HEC1649086.1 chromosome partitioning protein ParA [Yersinia enterocolitica]ATM88286.1 chromosome partitioning protein ParA [Yersinia frederiksenii]MCB5317066.1 chromosome partitioning protein ParA [Yersinia massiliensis]MDA5549083.1 chromosome partitioning protein ParA [Yersinia massiliensis]MDN0126190.1 chromosome partitioning protein ParA [Yersinia massiliensis]
MSENSVIQHMLSDLQSGYNKLSSDLGQLKNFQQQIELLKTRSNHDLNAKETLLRLDAAFPSGLAQEKAKIAASLSKITIQIKQLETQLKNINTRENR